MLRTTFLEIRLEFRPQPAQLWPDRILKDGFEFCSLQFERARQLWRAGKPVFMSPDFEKYRRIGVAHGTPQMSDDTLRRLWAVMEILANRVPDEPFPQLFCGSKSPTAHQNTPPKVDSHLDDKETSP